MFWNTSYPFMKIPFHITDKSFDLMGWLKASHRSDTAAATRVPRGWMEGRFHLKAAGALEGTRGGAGGLAEAAGEVKRAGEAELGGHGLDRRALEQEQPGLGHFQPDEGGLGAFAGQRGVAV